VLIHSPSANLIIDLERGDYLGTAMLGAFAAAADPVLGKPRLEVGARPSALREPVEDRHHAKRRDERDQVNDHLAGFLQSQDQ